MGRWMRCATWPQPSSPTRSLAPMSVAGLAGEPAGRRRHDLGRLLGRLARRPADLQIFGGAVDAVDVVVAAEQVARRQQAGLDRVVGVVVAEGAGPADELEVGEGGRVALERVER